MHRRTRTIIAGAVLAAAATAWTLSTLQSAAVTRTSGPIPHQAYVWQRAWGTDVQDSVRNTGGEVSRLVVLAAEVSFHCGAPRIARVGLNYQVLRESARPVGLALRIGPYRGPFASDDRAAAFIAGLAAKLARQAREAGLEPAELQIDFDCAQSKLDGYRLWVEAVRRETYPTPVTITALPCWLDRRGAFGRLIEAADGYVLQVHSLQLPKASDRRPCLCDIEAAKKAVERAARFGIPFRVALPTYGYIVAFNNKGKLLGISAEGPAGNLPEDVRVQVIGSDPAAIAELVRTWTQDRPANLTGIIWYRLPVATDTLNWRWQTLSKVMVGEEPKADLKVETRYPKPGLVEIDLLNSGSLDANTDVCVTVHWNKARVVASDAIGGFSAVLTGPNELRLKGPRAVLAPPLRPEERRTVGWIRLSSDEEVKAVVSPKS